MDGQEEVEVEVMKKEEVKEEKEYEGQTEGQVAVEAV
jgi:hypothetical protein